ncbi:hypothetical protein [Saccharothrix saharensis]|uniref:hypothetical protein n=1 Tax=Saccharothrix saharensis TaxID=571190 RepID=UPI001FED1B8C|nr:hypothetical protein [Saccharothrix saharensis]
MADGLRGLSQQTDRTGSGRDRVPHGRLSRHPVRQRPFERSAACGDAGLARVGGTPRLVLLERPPHVVRHVRTSLPQGIGERDPRAVDPVTQPSVLDAPGVRRRTRLDQPLRASGQRRQLKGVRQEAQFAAPRHQIGPCPVGPFPLLHRGRVAGLRGGERVLGLVQRSTGVLGVDPGPFGFRRHLAVDSRRASTPHESDSAAHDGEDERHHGHDEGTDHHQDEPAHQQHGGQPEHHGPQRGRTAGRGSDGGVVAVPGILFAASGVLGCRGRFALTVTRSCHGVGQGPRIDLRHTVGGSEVGRQAAQHRRSRRHRRLGRAVLAGRSRRLLRPVRLGDGERLPVGVGGGAHVLLDSGVTGEGWRELVQFRAQVVGSRAVEGAG